MTLYVYRSFFDLPSIDPISLQFIAISRFCASDIEIRAVRSAAESPLGVVPSFVDNEVEITKFEDFVDFMRNTHREIVLDYDLTAEQRALSTAYSAMVNEKLVPALEHLFWIDTFNYEAMTRPAYSSTLKFPHYLFFLHSRRNSTSKKFEALKKQPKDLLKDAISVLNSLSAKLGESKYFNGTKPTSLDAFLFGHLAPLLKLPLANENLKHHLESQPNLCIYLENIASIYMPLSEEQLRESLRNRVDIILNVDKSRKALEAQRNNDRIKKVEREKTDADSKQNLVVFGLVTLGLSLVFAIHSGIIRVSTRAEKA